MTANGPSYETTPPPNCPKCGKPLHVYQKHKFGEDQPEPSDTYLCYVHGFFTFTISDGLRAGF